MIIRLLNDDGNEDSTSNLAYMHVVTMNISKLPISSTVTITEWYAWDIQNESTN